MTLRELCDYCGEPGHDWSVHPQAVSDVRAWRREEDASRESDEWMAED